MVRSRPALTNNYVNNQVAFSKSSMNTRRFFSSKPSGCNNILLHPSFVTGFVDGEGSFGVNVRKDSRSRLG